MVIGNWIKIEMVGEVEKRVDAQEVKGDLGLIKL